MTELGMPQRDAATLRVLTDDVLKTSEIEGEQLNPDTVRSSIARRLGLDIGALAPADRHVDGVVEMVLDATGAHAQPLTRERLFGWHAALFPTGYSGLAPIRTGAWRDDAAGPMQVVSGPVGRRKVHFEAPPAQRLEAEMARFLEWFELSRGGDPLRPRGPGPPVVRHAPSLRRRQRPHRARRGRHGAGPRRRIEPQRFYSLSAQIQRERKDYYEMLERTQKGTMDVTPWLAWFLGCLLRAIEGAEASLSTRAGQVALLAALGRRRR